MTGPSNRSMRACGIALALLCAGCETTFTYEVERYGTTAGVPVHLGCNDTYEVFDRPEAGSLLVVTNVLNESLGTRCADGAGLLPRPERMRQVARIFLDEPGKRPECRIGRERELGSMQTEFNYRCPLPPAPTGPARPASSRR